MKVNKEILIDLFERMDKKRRKILYEHYSELVITSLSAFYVAEMISSELGRPELVKANDVRYCRYYFRSKPAPFTRTPIKSEPLLPSPAPESKPHHTQPTSVNNPDALRWSDPDTMNMQDKIVRKSKFGKTDET